MDIEADNFTALRRTHLHDATIDAMYRDGPDLIVDITPEPWGAGPGAKFDGVRRLVFENARKRVRGKSGFPVKAYWMWHEVTFKDGHYQTLIVTRRGRSSHECVILADSVQIEYGPP